MRAVGNAAGMQGHHTRMDVIPREELTAVIEDHLVVIIVVVIEGYPQRARIALEGPRTEGADHKALCGKGGVGRGRHMIAMAHERSDVAPVEPHRHQRPVPAHRIEGIKGVAYGAEEALA